MVAVALVVMAESEMDRVEHWVDPRSRAIASSVEALGKPPVCATRLTGPTRFRRQNRSVGRAPPRPLIEGQTGYTGHPPDPPAHRLCGNDGRTAHRYLTTRQQAQRFCRKAVKPIKP